MDTEFERQLKELKAKRCYKCKGHGTLNDAEPGDISFNIWECDRCRGSGFEPSEQSRRKDVHKS